MNKKVSQLKANHPLANKCSSYIANKFEQVRKGGTQVNKVVQGWDWREVTMGRGLGPGGRGVLGP